VPSIGGSVSSLSSFKGLPDGAIDPESVPRAETLDEIMAPGGFDQVERPDIFGAKAPYLPLGSRPDVLVFQTDPLEEDTEVTGPIEVRLWVSSSAVDTDFTAKLIDVYPSNRWYPQGYRLNLSDSIMRLRYRNGDGQPDFLTPGDVAELTITLYPTSNVFARGHRIRLDVSSSNFPRFDVNPNTGEAIGRERRRVTADNTVYHEAGRSSVLVLPIVPE
jgi:putative CocE/NonD family hydrolase